MDNRSLSHTRWKCQYHIVFIPKYRKKVLYGKVREDVREILSILCKYKNVENNSRSSMHRSCASQCGNTTQIEHSKFYGVSKRKEYTDDIRQAPGNAK